MTQNINAMGEEVKKRTDMQFNSLLQEYMHGVEMQSIEFQAVQSNFIARFDAVRYNILWHFFYR